MNGISERGQVININGLSDKQGLCGALTELEREIKEEREKCEISAKKAWESYKAACAKLKERQLPLLNASKNLGLFRGRPLHLIKRYKASHRSPSAYWISKAKEKQRKIYVYSLQLRNKNELLLKIRELVADLDRLVFSSNILSTKITLPPLLAANLADFFDKKRKCLVSS